MMNEFSAQTYDTIINLLSSALAGIGVFVLGLFMGWLFWRDHGRRALRRVDFSEMASDFESGAPEGSGPESNPDKG